VKTPTAEKKKKKKKDRQKKEDMKKLSKERVKKLRKRGQALIRLRIRHGKREGKRRRKTVPRRSGIITRREKHGE